MNNKWLYFFFTITFLVNCNNQKNEDTNSIRRNGGTYSEVNENVENLIGKTFYIPDSLEIIGNDHNTLIPTPASIKNSEWKIVSYINGDCGSCVSHLKEWDILLKYWKKEKKIKEMIFVGTNNLEMFKFILYEKDTYDGELIFDRSEKIIKSFPEDKSLQTFLLKNDKIFLVGDPTGNEKIEALYEKALSKVRN